MMQCGSRRHVSFIKDQRKNSPEVKSQLLFFSSTKQHTRRRSVWFSVRYREIMTRDGSLDSKKQTKNDRPFHLSFQKGPSEPRRTCNSKSSCSRTRRRLFNALVRGISNSNVPLSNVHVKYPGMSRQIKLQFTSYAMTLFTS